MNQKLLRISLMVLTLVVASLLLMSNTHIVEETKVNNTTGVPEKVYENKTSYLSVFSGIFLLLLFIYQLRNYFQKPSMELIDKDEATNYYFHEWLPNERKIGVPASFLEYYSDETGMYYRMIASWEDQKTGERWFAPIEIKKYYEYDSKGNKKIPLGHGRGRITTSIEEVQAFMNRDSHTVNKQAMMTVVPETMEQLFDERFNERMRESKQSSSTEVSR